MLCYFALSIELFECEQDGVELCVRLIGVRLVGCIVLKNFGLIFAWHGNNISLAGVVSEVISSNFCMRFFLAIWKQVRC